MRTLRVVALSVMVLLSGCADSPDTTPDSTSESPQDAGVASDANATVEPDVEPVNLAPEALLGIEGFNATDLANGTVNVTVPATLNFTLDGSDAEGQNLTWQLAINGTQIANGTELPAIANHTFESAGLVNVTFAVSDGINTTTVLLVLNATLGAAPEPTLLAEFSNSGIIGGAYALKGEPDFAHLCPGFNAGQSGYGCVFVEYDAETIGMPAIVTTDAGNLRLAFWDECSALGHGVAWAEGSSGLAIELPDAGCMVAWSSSIGDWGSTKTFTISVYDFLL